MKTKTLSPKKAAAAKTRRGAAIATPTDLGAKATKDLSGALNAILADVFAIYLKTKNFHWHMSGPHFRDYHLLLDEQADQLYAMTDPIAERISKLGGQMLRSIGELREDNKTLAARLRGCTTCATSIATSPPRASSRSGSTRPSGAPGSCSNRAGGADSSEH